MYPTPKEFGFRERTFTMHLAHPVQDVFPLLCPVREYDWIATWRCELIHSASGVAEEGCVFTTAFPNQGRATWVCTRYDPPRAVHYTIFFDSGFIRRLRLSLTPRDQGCEVLWRHSYTALTPKGAAAMDAEDDASYEGVMRYLEQSLDHYLSTGQCLKAPDDMAGKFGHGSLLSRLHRKAHGNVHGR